jgi:hypothetical protein
VRRENEGSEAALTRAFFSFTSSSKRYVQRQLQW